MILNLADAFETLTTPLLADACVRLRLPVRAAPPGIRPLTPSQRLAGPVFPCGHYGSVDIFLEALTLAAAGSVLVIDNEGRLDEGCIGDLIALEAREAGMAGMVIWGAHRDTAELLGLDFPIFSYGACAVGPQRLDPQPASAFEQAHFGPHTISQQDMVFADCDGVLFIAAEHLPAVLQLAAEIRDKERHEATLMQQGISLRQQLAFGQYLEERASNPAYTFRQHINRLGGAVE
ncbi:MAG: RraA family protein [Chloroflexota bacterium]|nr:MAG: dimethylmenaquinone methyltransferase [Chloroflexota bacterium]